MAATLHLVRHAEPGDHHGLSDRGRAQARVLGRRLSGLGVAAIHHGPAARTTQTARHLADAVGCAQARPTGLLGDLTPTPAPGQEQAYPRRLRDWLDRNAPADPDPGGQRLTRAFEHFAADPSPSVLVTHAFVIGWFVRAALDAPAHRWMELFADHASLTTIEIRDDGRPPALVRFNDTGHLD